MAEIRFSLLHASYRSSGQAKQVRDYWFSKAKFPDRVEHCLGFESSDSQVREEFNLPAYSQGVSPDLRTIFRTTTPQRTPSAVRNWNAAASISSGRILIGIADDLVPEFGWDIDLWDKISPHLETKGLWKVNDSRCVPKKIENLGDILPRHPVINRKLYEEYGFYFNPKYYSVGPDDEWLLEGIKNSFFNDAREIFFHHAIGPIFSDAGNLQCGCFVKSSPRSSTPGQARMHQSEWRIKANENLKTWSLPWRVISGFSVSYQIPDQILLITSRFPELSGSRIIVKILFNSKIRIKYRFGVVLEILKQFI